jgi:hypothetical protein
MNLITKSTKHVSKIKNFLRKIKDVASWIDFFKKVIEYFHYILSEGVILVMGTGVYYSWNVYFGIAIMIFSILYGWRNLYKKQEIKNNIPFIREEKPLENEDDMQVDEPDEFISLVDAAGILKKQINRKGLTHEQKMKWDAYIESGFDAFWFFQIRAYTGWNNKFIEIILKLVKECKEGNLIFWGEEPPLDFKEKIIPYYINDNGYSFDHKFNFIKNESSIQREGIPHPITFKNICLEKKPFMKWMKKTLSSVIHDQD